MERFRTGNGAAWLDLLSTLAGRYRDEQVDGIDTAERLRGYFTAPTTANYYFWIAASNNAELWISNDAEPVNKIRRASVTAPGTNPRTWNTQLNQKSAWLSLGRMRGGRELEGI